MTSRTLQIIVMMHGHEDFRFVAVESMGFVRSYNPRTIAGDIQTMIDVSARDVTRMYFLIASLNDRPVACFLQLPSNEWRYVHFPVVPVIEAGEITVVIEAFSILRTDYEELTIEIEVTSQLILC